MTDQEIANILLKHGVIKGMAEFRRLKTQNAIKIEENGDIRIGKNRIIKQELTK
jgi:hypothetical protein